MTGPALTVIVVAFDSLAPLRETLPALCEQLGDEDELVVVDNASRDGLAAALPAIAPGARLVSLADNVGFAGGVNAGARGAGGDLLVLLNPDARVAPGWAAAIRAPWGGEWAAWMGLVALGDGAHVNTSGGVVHFTGFGWAGEIGRPVAEVEPRPHDVGFLSGACLAVPRLTWESLGGFPERFFMYCEDLDLSLRLRLLAGRIAVVPAARVDHDYDFAKGGLKWRLLERNRWATILRTYPGPVLAVVAPALLVTELAVWAMAARGGWAGEKAQATLELARDLPALRAERRAIQASARISPAQFAAGLTAQLSSPYFGSLGANRLVRAAMAAYWGAATSVLRRLR